MLKSHNDTGSEHKEAQQVRSAWEIAQERAESLLHRSDEELEQEDQMKGKQQGTDSRKGPLTAGSASQVSSDQAAEYLEHLQRLQAEFANYRKRVERDKAEFVKYATANLLFELTEVLDDFERGLHGDHASEVPESYIKGIEGVYRKLSEVLSRQGLQRIKTLGEPFNPEIHEAAVQEETDQYPPGTICGEIRAGYTLGDRLLRAPLVRVAVPPRGQTTSTEKNESTSESSGGE